MLKLIMVMMAMMRMMFRTRMTPCCRGLKKHGGKIQLNAHVAEIEASGGQATGVRLRNGHRIRAKKAVVSNASLWDTLSLLPADQRPADLKQKAKEIPMNRSFMRKPWLLASLAW